MLVTVVSSILVTAVSQKLVTAVLKKKACKLFNRFTRFCLFHRNGGTYC